MSEAITLLDVAHSAQFLLQNRFDGVVRISFLELLEARFGLVQLSLHAQIGDVPEPSFR